MTHRILGVVAAAFGLAGLIGAISQRPPAYSAIKVGGRRAYAMARAGERVELADRAVTIHAFDLVSWDDTDPDRPIAGWCHHGARSAQVVHFLMQQGFTQTVNIHGGIHAWSHERDPAVPVY